MRFPVGHCTTSQTLDSVDTTIVISYFTLIYAYSMLFIITTSETQLYKDMMSRSNVETVSYLGLVALFNI